MPQYQGVWNLAQQAQALTRQQWVTDPLYDYTTLLLQADGTSGGAQNNAFIDSSNNYFFITRNGNTTQGSFSPFSATGWSGYFNGSTDYLGNTTTSVSGFDLSTGDWTVEAWVYPTALSSVNVILNLPNASGSNSGLNFYIDSTGKLFQDNGSTATTGAGAVSLNTWTHVAAVRISGSTQLYVNGTAVGSAITQAPNTAQYFLIGRLAAISANYFTGYISNLRVVKGRGVYTANFTPPTSALGAISGGTNPPTGTQTSLLTCQSNRFVDNGGLTTPNAITVNGTPSVQAFSPFAPQFQYSPTVTGGSGYFDGTGDFLQTPSSTNLNLATGDFTIEAWVYRTSAATSDGIFNSVAATGANSGLSFYVGTDSKLYLDNGVTGTTGYGAVGGNQWNHVAVIRTSSNAYLYVNGVCVNPANPITQSPNTGGIGLVGCAGITTQQLFDGYISNLRVIKGQALVTGGNNFTPPTAPVTATSIGWTGANVAASLTGTVQFLLNFTNAGILDGTMKNNLETVGNAQVSTSVVKYGSGSMFFDGTGDYITFPASQNFNLSTGDFTVECWFYFSTTPPSGTGYDYLWGLGANNTNGLGLYVQGGVPKIWNGSLILTTTGSISATTWYHIAVVRFNGRLTVYLDGVSIGSVSMTSDLTGGGSVGFNIARWINAADANEFTGYIDDFRITKGIARYTRNFTPPQVALPRQ